MEIADPSKNYLCNSIPEQINYFSGRKTELEQAKQILSNKKRVIITGIGGIGKSEFSKQFARKNIDNYSSIVWVKYEDNFSNTLLKRDNFIIANGIEKIQSSDHCSYEKKIEVIASVVDKDTLVIIDDVKNFSEKALYDFLKLQCNVMMTTSVYERINIGYRIYSSRLYGFSRTACHFQPLL